MFLSNKKHFWKNKTWSRRWYPNWNKVGAAIKVKGSSQLLQLITISKFENFDPLSQNIDHPILKAIVKYKKHPSVIVIALEFTNAFLLTKSL